MIMADMGKNIIEEIKSRINLVDLISAYGIELAPSGAGYKALCPFHQEKTPSFHVDSEKKRFKCFGCGEGGDAITFVMRKDGLNYQEAVTKLADKCSISFQSRKGGGWSPDLDRLYTLHGSLADFFHRYLFETKEGEVARKYLLSRFIPLEKCINFDIGYVPNDLKHIFTWAKEKGYSNWDLVESGIVSPPSKEYGSWYNRFGGRLVFSIKDKIGRVVGFSGRILDDSRNDAKYINSPESPIFKKGNLLFGLNLAAKAISKDKSKKLIVCEGQIDVIRCHINGFDTAVASLGTGFTTGQVDLLNQISDKVVIAYDGDAAGVKAAIRAGKLFLGKGIYVTIARLPEGCDPDSYILENGVASFKDCLTKSMSIVKFQLDEYRKEDLARDSIEYAYTASKLATEIISLCPNAVLKVALCKEVASYLDVPVSAIEHGLAQNSYDRYSTTNNCLQDSHNDKIDCSLLRSLELTLCSLLLEYTEMDAKKTLQKVEEGLDWNVIESEDVASFIRTWMSVIYNVTERDMIKEHPVFISYLSEGSRLTSHLLKQDSELSYATRLKDIFSKLKILKVARLSMYPIGIWYTFVGIF